MDKYKGFSIEVYQVRSGRCWGCCQDNCSSCRCSCHTDTDSRYRIVKGSLTVHDSGSRKPDLVWYVNTALNLTKIKSKYAKKRNKLKEEIGEINRQEALEIKKVKKIKEYRD